MRGGIVGTLWGAGAEGGPEKVEQKGEDGEEEGGNCRSDEGIFAEGELELAGVHLEGAEAAEHDGGDVFEVSVVVFAAEAVGDLAEGGDVLAGLAAVDEGAFDGVADADDEGAADGLGEAGHAGGGDGVAIGDEEEGGGGGGPGFGDLGGGLEAVEEAGFPGGEDLVHGEAVEDVEEDFAVAALFDDDLGAVVGGDDGEEEFLVGDALEEGLDDGGGALGAAEVLIDAGVAEFHGGGDVEDEDDVLALAFLDLLHGGAVGFWGEEEEGGEGPGEEGEGDDAVEGGDGAEGGGAESGAEGEAGHTPDAAVVEEFGTGC